MIFGYGWFITTVQPKARRMHLKTILNRVTNYKSFVFGKITWQEDALTPAVDVEVQPRSNGRPVCSGCGKRRPGYDTMPTPRRFDFIPLWGIAVVFVYSMRRVDCPACGVKVERVPWAEGKSTMTVEYAWYLAKWARADVVEGSVRGAACELGSRVCGGKTSSELGFGASGSGIRCFDRRG